MNKECFENRFNKKFVPEFRYSLKERALSQKAVLLLDSAPSHLNIFTQLSHYCKVVAPCSVVTIIQGMDQGVIASV
jgi:hypothetical protein